MKFAYRVINKNKNIINLNEEGGSLPKTISEKVPVVVSFILVAKVKLCFRECAEIIKIAEDTGCVVEMASGTKSGDSSSILSLVNLGITADKTLVLTIKGDRNKEAFDKISKIISGEASVAS